MDVIETIVFVMRIHNDTARIKEMNDEGTERSVEQERWDYDRAFVFLRDSAFRVNDVVGIKKDPQEGSLIYLRGISVPIFTERSFADVLRILQEMPTYNVKVLFGDLKMLERETD